MADSKFTAPPTAFEYTHNVWGELIYGTKAEIQALGIGAGLSFPGEDGGPRRFLTVLGPRGFPARIERWFDEETFCVRIDLFPEHPKPEPRPQLYAPGVTRRESPGGDLYHGTAEALAASGLIALNQLPGQPGMRKMRVRLLPDGSAPAGAPTANCAAMRNPGAKEIERAGIGMFRVRVMVSKEEYLQRTERQHIADSEWERRIQALPRPAPLRPMHAHALHEAPFQRAHSDAGFQLFLQRAINANI